MEWIHKVDGAMNDWSYRNMVGTYIGLGFVILFFSFRWVWRKYKKSE